MKFTEYTDLDNLLQEICDDGQYTICQINMKDRPFKVSTKNGYKIFKIIITNEDPFFEPEDWHGYRFYTFLSNKFKDCKAVAIPYISFARLTDEEAIKHGFDRGGKDGVFDWYINFENSPEFTVYIGNGYMNVLTHKCCTNLFFDDESSLEGSEIGLVIVLDCMYKNRNNALNKLLSLTEIDD